jgi:carnitine-CoA ligase
MLAAGRNARAAEALALTYLSVGIASAENVRYRQESMETAAATETASEALRIEERVIGTLLRSRAQSNPNGRFCSCEDASFTFAEMDRRSDEVAAGFHARGVRQGGRVAVLAPNRVEMLELFFGLAKLGAIQVPLNAFLKGSFLKHQLAQSRASALVSDAAGLAGAAPLLDELPGLQLLVALDRTDLPTPTGLSVVPYAAASSGGGAPPGVALTPSDAMSIVYTSGTTGLPKGCVLSHGYYTRSGWTFGSGLGVSGDDTIYTPLPLFHGGGRMMVLTMALISGIPVHFDTGFSASRFIARAAEREATIVVAIGAMGMALLATPESEADRQHRIHTIAVAPLTPHEQERLRARFGIEPWVEVYGQTECVPLTISRRIGARDRAGCGFAPSDLEVKLLDDDMNEVSDGELGEICIRPRERWTMFDGYWEQPEETLRAFRGLWYHTGDAGRKLPSGAFAFVDRKKDALRRRGENVSSIELEVAIRTHPKVADVAVHAIPSPVGEDDIKACVVLRPGETFTAQEAFDFLCDTLPYYAMPRYVELMDDLPRNAVNRVMKHLLRERPLDSERVWDFDALGIKLSREQRRGAG